MSVPRLASPYRAAALSAAALFTASSVAAETSGPAGAASVTETMWSAARPALTAPLSAEPDFSPAFGPGTTVATFSIEEQPDGDAPSAVAWTADGSRFVVVHRDTDNLTIHEGLTGRALETIPVGDFPTDVAITPDAATAVVTNLLAGSVSLVDLTSGAVSATVPVTGDQPFRVRVTADGSRAAVAVVNDGAPSAFSIIDLSTATEVAVVPVAGMGAIGFTARVETGAFRNFFTDFALTPAGLAVAYDRAEDRVSVVDVTTGTLVGTAPVPDGPDAIDVTPDGAQAVVGCDTDDRLVVVDLATVSVVDDFALPAFNDRIVRVTPDGSEAIVFAGNLITFVDLDTGAVTGTVDHTNFVRFGLEFTGDGSHAVVTSSRARVIDVATRTLRSTIVAPTNYAAAAAPTGTRLAAIATLDDTVSVLDGNGAGASLLATEIAGEPNEGDDPFHVAIAPGGDLAVVGGLTSGNAVVMELPSGTVRAWIDCGERVKRAAISPDGRTAIVLAMDANAIQVIDLATDTITATLTVSTRPGRVLFSPDSTEAYVLNIAGTDRVSFIELEPVPTIVAQVSAGQTGAANGPTYTELSGLALSPDGSTLAVCDSFNDAIRLYDTATRSLVATVPTGDFPLSATFTPDGSQVWASNHFGDSVTAIAVAGGASSVLGTISGMDRFPIEIAFSPDGQTGFVAVRQSAGVGNDAVLTVDVATRAVQGAIFGFGGYPRTMDMATDGTLRIATTGSTLAIVENAGPFSFIDELLELPGPPKAIAHDDVSDRTVIVGPPLDAVAYIGDVAPDCPADLDESGDVGLADLLSVLAGWNEPGPADLDQDGAVDLDDLLSVLAAWVKSPGLRLIRAPDTSQPADRPPTARRGRRPAARMSRVPRR